MVKTGLVPGSVLGEGSHVGLGSVGLIIHVRVRQGQAEGRSVA